MDACTAWNIRIRSQTLTGARYRCRLGPAAAPVETAAAGVVLIAIGAYELTPWKHDFLQTCRASQVAGRPYSLACLGASWALMGTLFVLGVLNYFWIAGLALLIAAQKSLPWGGALASAAGIGFIIWGGLKLLVV